MGRELDKYLNDYPAIYRLVVEWVKHGKLIIAYDFDNTVYDLHDENLTFDFVNELLNRCKKIGATFVVYTHSTKSRHPQILSYLKDNNFPVDYINESPVDLTIPGEGGSYKIYYNILLDDRAGLRSSFLILDKACDVMEENPKDEKEACNILNTLLSLKKEC